MRKRLILLLTPIAALAAIAVSASVAASPTASVAAAASCATVTSGQLTIGTDNPAYPPWYAGGSKSSWKINDPSTGKGYESAVAYAIAKKLGYSKAQVKWTYVPFNKAFAPGTKSFDFDINQISFTPARAKVVSFSTSYYDVNQALVVNKGTKIASVRSIKGLAPYKLGAPARHDELHVHQEPHQAVAAAGRLQLERGCGARAEEQADRRARRRPADGVLRHGRRRCRTARSSASSRTRAPRPTASASCSRRATR